MFKNFIKGIICIIIVSLLSLQTPFSIKLHANNEDVVAENIYFESTQKLIERIIDIEFNYIYLFSTIEIGIEKFKINNEYYKVLEKKEDSMLTLNNMILYASYSDEYKNRIELLINMLQNETNLNLGGTNYISSTSSNNIYTPNGSVVETALYMTGEMSQTDIIGKHNFIISEFPSIEESDYIYPASRLYNCHSYAWYSQDVDSNNYWIGYPDSYIDDQSYVAVGGIRPGDILCYYSYGYNSTNGEHQLSEYITHSAIIESVDYGFDINDFSTLDKIHLISKWGEYGVYRHEADECDYGPTEDATFRYFRVYRPKTHNSYILTDTMNDINISKSMSGNGQIYSNYGMYELDVQNEGEYEIIIESNRSLDNRLYNVHMNKENLNLISSSSFSYKYILSLLDDIYYLRTSYYTANYNGIININIKAHSHSFNNSFSWKNSLNHIAYCECDSYRLMPHAVEQGTTTCIQCGGQADIGINPYSLNTNTVLIVSVNGSYILPNGIIVLVKEDIQDYLNGTLLFQNKNNKNIRYELIL